METTTLTNKNTFFLKFGFQKQEYIRPLYGRLFPHRCQTSYIFAQKPRMDAYSIFLNIHSVIRWIVLILATIVIIKSLMGMFGKPTYGKIDNIFAAALTGSMHLQLLLGIILYLFLSPITDTAMNDFGTAMKSKELRFWAVEHLTLMIGAVILAQIGRSKSKKLSDVRRKYRIQAIFFGISFILMMLGIPWNRFI